MRLVEFLIQLLEAHAETLKRLGAIFGEDMLLHILEVAGETETPPEEHVLKFKTEWFDASQSTGYTSAYAQLESAVHEFKLPAVLEFHLWAYPHYRAFIESPLDLNSRILGPGNDAGLALVDEAVAQAEAWVKKLPLPPEASAHASRAAHVPWLRFRTTVLKRIGKRPMGPVY